MSNKKYLDYAGLKRVLAKLLPGARKIWHGTLEEWEALAAAERDKYDQAEIIDENDLPEVLRNPDWSRAVSYTANELKGGITAPEDGLFVGSFISAVNATPVLLTVNGVVVSTSTWVSGAWRSDGDFQVPVSKGDIIRAMNEIHTTINCNFVPYKTDVVDNRFPTNYSTQEQFTGKYWIDGKKIYQKTIVYNKAAGTSPTLVINIDNTLVNIEDIVHIEGTFKHSNGSTGNYYILPIDRAYAKLDTNNNSILYSIDVYANTAAGVLANFSSGYNNIPGTLKATVYYTKATD